MEDADFVKLANDYDIEDHAALKRVIDDAAMAAEGVQYWWGDPVVDEEAPDRLDELVGAIVRTQLLLNDDRNFFRLAEALEPDDPLAGNDRLYDFVNELERIRVVARAAHVPPPGAGPPRQMEVQAKEAATVVLAGFWKGLGRPVDRSRLRKRFPDFAKSAVTEICGSAPSDTTIRKVVAEIRKK